MMILNKCTYFYFWFEIDFNIKLSKNQMWKKTNRGHIYLNPETKVIRDDIAQIVKLKCDVLKVTPQKAKTWVDLEVIKPNNRSDALNFIDAICDAVKIGLDVDDRWFSLSGMDWSIDKENPRIKIGVGQNLPDGHRVCNKCALTRTESDFEAFSQSCLGCRVGQAEIASNNAVYGIL